MPPAERRIITKTLNGRCLANHREQITYTPHRPLVDCHLPFSILGIQPTHTSQLRLIPHPQMFASFLAGVCLLHQAEKPSVSAKFLIPILPPSPSPSHSHSPSPSHQQHFFLFFLQRFLSFLFPFIFH